MFDPRKIIIEPVLSEKALRLREYNQYVFKVAKEANKIDIKRAVEELFKVKVEKVRTINMRGKPRRLGIFSGRTSSWKKAIVTLKEGEKIEGLER
ncbi:MAG: 50S ribosomal protein L23 [candidate division WOR-3 bacterium]|nr:50S ribosomal protein L23 [candidate division WOR-3 bacterium]MCX7837220.1 50S ribosomal protein L23 [candidate division WOR-3 bacterium]MDW8114373.1 50S ribosomal protein L23 [candidate division WOR-3 bacterium]